MISCGQIIDFYKKTLFSIIVEPQNMVYFNNIHTINLNNCFIYVNYMNFSTLLIAVHFSFSFPIWTSLFFVSILFANALFQLDIDSFFEFI